MLVGPYSTSTKGSMTGLDQTATTCLGAETPDPFAVPAPHVAQATPSMTADPEATRNPKGSIAQEQPSPYTFYTTGRMQGQDVGAIRRCRIHPVA